MVRKVSKSFFLQKLFLQSDIVAHRDVGERTLCRFVLCHRRRREGDTVAQHVRNDHCVSIRIEAFPRPDLVLEFRVDSIEGRWVEDDPTPFFLL